MHGATCRDQHASGLSCKMSWWGMCTHNMSLCVLLCPWLRYFGVLLPFWPVLGLLCAHDDDPASHSRFAVSLCLCVVQTQPWTGVRTFLWLSLSVHSPHPSSQCWPSVSEPPGRQRKSPSSCTRHSFEFLRRAATGALQWFLLYFWIMLTSHHKHLLCHINATCIFMWQNTFSHYCQQVPLNVCMNVFIK